MPKSDADIQGIKVSRQAGLADTCVLIHTGQTLFYAIHVVNRTSATAFVQFFNAAAITDVTLGTTTPVMSLGIHGSTNEFIHMPKALNDFPLGLVVASTTDVGDAIGAEQDVMVFYA